MIAALIKKEYPEFIRYDFNDAITASPTDKHSYEIRGCGEIRAAADVKAKAKKNLRVKVAACAVSLLLALVFLLIASNEYIIFFEDEIIYSDSSGFGQTVCDYSNISKIEKCDTYKPLIGAASQADYYVIFITGRTGQTASPARSLRTRSVRFPKNQALK